jgi:hypothetical protein
MLSIHNPRDRERREAAEEPSRAADELLEQLREQVL